MTADPHEPQIKVSFAVSADHALMLTILHDLLLARQGEIPDALVSLLSAFIETIGLSHEITRPKGKDLVTPCTELDGAGQRGANDTTVSFTCDTDTAQHLVALYGLLNTSKGDRIDVMPTAVSGIAWLLNEIAWALEEILITEKIRLIEKSAMETGSP